MALILYYFQQARTPNGVKVVVRRGIASTLTLLYGGINKKRILSGIIKVLDLYHVAPSHTNTIISLGYDLDKY